jgi:hypothetical protein
MCRATVTAEGVVFEARGILRLVAPPFTLRYDQIRSIERLRVPGLAGPYIHTTVQGFDRVLFSGWPTSIRVLDDALRTHQVATYPQNR